MSAALTHLNEKGEAHIVDVGGKAVTARRAVAEARITAEPATVAAIMGGTLGKGDALAVARIAGIMAAKKTSELIPLCHPIALNKVEIEIASAAGHILVTATAEATDRTGVEMEAMTAAAVAALTLYDMAKSIDRAMSFTVALIEKSGGKSGPYRRATGR
ncbi:MAG TPA: cyclic pyranopterin monophosphate synthase MoaC [Devosia sp.]|nr:cyclic pyranopterin monophosphate synthase MoaC [Devosia sp.]